MITPRDTSGAGGVLDRYLTRVLTVVTIALMPVVMAGQNDPPRVSVENGAGRLTVHGKPFLIRGGELGNSSAGTAAEADEILPRMKKMHLNTVLMPVAWEHTEPVEGQFDFSILDHWIDVARHEDMHLVLLWFGSWKNAFSEYAPAWVKSDTKRFPRQINADGQPTEILSPLSAETQRCDSRAFAALMRHLKVRDGAQQTVLMIQVENEIGFLGRGGRDRSAEANRMFEDPVPAALIKKLTSANARLTPELAQHFNATGRNWREEFGDAADEVFMAWSYGRFVDAVAEAGGKEYELPMYANAQLPAPMERGGEYPSGGPHPFYLDVWRAAAPSIDFYAPDVYWPDFEYWVSRYTAAGNPAFVPEARLDVAPYIALWLYGEARGFGFSPFGIDSLRDSATYEKGPALGDAYAVIDDLNDALVDAQAKNHSRALVLHAASARPTKTVALGGYLFEATLARTWPARTLATDDGTILIIESSPGEFLIAGSGLTVAITRDPDTDARVAGIASIEQIAKQNGQWITERRLNGDQSNQGRQLMLEAHEMRVYRVKLYSYPR
jgi:beta-galactosidase GanA